MRRGPTQVGGFTLIEVLVSIVILSIGLLGIAKLMLFSSRSNDSAYLRSQATALAYEILDNMRANRQEAINLTYNTALGAMASTAAPPAALCISPVLECTTTQLAVFDVYQWKLRLNTASIPACRHRGIAHGTRVGDRRNRRHTNHGRDPRRLGRHCRSIDFRRGGRTDKQTITLETVL